MPGLCNLLQYITIVLNLHYERFDRFFCVRQKPQDKEIFPKQGTYPALQFENVPHPLALLIIK
jgi:hypothetical protein